MKVIHPRIGGAFYRAAGERYTRRHSDQRNFSLQIISFSRQHVLLQPRDSRVVQRVLCPILQPTHC